MFAVIILSHINVKPELNVQASGLWLRQTR